MAKNFVLYWSHLKMYEQCPQKFLWTKGWEDVDIGYGPGKPMPKPLKRSEHDAYMGVVIQAVIEKFYNDDIWKQALGREKLEEYLKKSLSQYFHLKRDRFYIDWAKSPTRQELYEVCEDGVLGFIETFRHYKLLGEYARSEVEVIGWLNNFHPIGGIVDFIIRKPGDLLLLDGKNSKQKNKYLDPDQLRWYALCMLVAHNEFPTKLGWLYWRYPYGKICEGSEEPEAGVEWVDCDRSHLKHLGYRATNVRNGMNDRKFDPTPSGKNCNFCPFETVCDARIKQKAANSAKRKKSHLFDKTPDGFVDFSFGGSGGDNG